MRLIQTTQKALEADPSAQGVWLHLRAQQQLAKTYEKLGRLTHARATLQTILDLIERYHVNPKTNLWGPSLVWGPLNQLGRLHIKSGDLGAAYEAFKLAMKVVQECKDPFGEVTVTANIASLYLMNRSYKKAHQALKHAVDMARRRGQMKMLAKLKYNQGMLYMDIQNPDMAREAWQESEALSHAMNWREGIAQVHHQLKRVEALS